MRWFKKKEKVKTEEPRTRVPTAQQKFIGERLLADYGPGWRVEYGDPETNQVGMRRKDPRDIRDVYYDRQGRYGEGWNAHIKVLVKETETVVLEWS